MIDFEEHVLKSAKDAEAFVAETGGLPEIDRATADLRVALDQTRNEIETAEFASRFPNPPSEFFRTMSEEAGLTWNAKAAIEEEGEAGLKRESLKARHLKIENDLLRLIGDLVELRTDLKVSQIEM